MFEPLHRLEQQAEEIREAFRKAARAWASKQPCSHRIFLHGELLCGHAGINGSVVDVTTLVQEGDRVRVLWAEEGGLKGYEGVVQCGKVYLDGDCYSIGYTDEFVLEIL